MVSSNDSMNGVGLVTGAGSGIGLASVRGLLDAGCRKILMADLSADNLNKIRTELLGTYPDTDIEVAAVDVADEKQVDAMVAQAVNKWGRLDYAVNSAGVGRAGAPIGKTSLEEYDRVVNVNERGVFLCMRAQLSQMEKQEQLNPGFRGQRGSIVNISSIAGYKSIPNCVAYTASKHAVIGMTKVAAVDYTGKNIRVNALAPGWINTGMTQAPLVRAMVEYSTNPRRCPAARPGEAEEMADVIVFLLSEKASYVNGTTWQADGGLMCN